MTHFTQVDTWIVIDLYDTEVMISSVSCNLAADLIKDDSLRAQCVDSHIYEIQHSGLQ